MAQRRRRRPRSRTAPGEEIRELAHLALLPRDPLAARRAVVAAAAGLAMAGLQREAVVLVAAVAVHVVAREVGAGQDVAHQLFRLEELLPALCERAGPVAAAAVERAVEGQEVHGHDGDDLGLGAAVDLGQNVAGAGRELVAALACRPSPISPVELILTGIRSEQQETHRQPGLLASMSVSTG